MPRAYVLVNVESQHKIKETLTEIRKKKEVKSAEAIFGPYDIIVMLEDQDLEALSTIVIDNLNVDDRYATCMVIE